MTERNKKANGRPALREATQLAGKSPGSYGIPGVSTLCKVDKVERYDLASKIGKTLDVAGQSPDVIPLLKTEEEKVRADRGGSLKSRPGAGLRKPDRLQNRETSFATKE